MRAEWGVSVLSHRSERRRERRPSSGIWLDFPGDSPPLSVRPSFFGDVRHTMKVLFASRYVDPGSPRSNHNIIKQARVLQERFGVDLSILTWPTNDTWSGIQPQHVPTMPPLTEQRGGLAFQVIRASPRWDEVAGGNSISTEAWNAAVAYGMKLLSVAKPDLLHLHHRMGFWWLLESGQRLGIPTVYTNYDWGIACLRTLLVTSDGTLCHGRVDPATCAQCITRGRSRKAAKINEALADTLIGSSLLSRLEKLPLTSDWFHRTNLVSQPALQRTTQHLRRVQRVMRGIGHCITPSDFGRTFFRQFGLPDERITVLPWAHDVVDVPPIRLSKDAAFTITYIGRVSPEKGLHLALHALETLNYLSPVRIRIAGVDDSSYCTMLRNKYPVRAGIHDIEWLMWSPIDQLLRMTDVVIVPSIAMDNTPVVLLEAMAHRIPVIATRLPTIEPLVPSGLGYLAEFSSVRSLADAIQRAAADQAVIRAGMTGFPRIPDWDEYGSALMRTYETVLAGTPERSSGQGTDVFLRVDGQDGVRR
jgi:glycosyltransferase involved in cell wall biosynthesis